MHLGLTILIWCFAIVIGLFTLAIVAIVLGIIVFLGLAGIGALQAKAHDRRLKRVQNQRLGL